MSDSQTIENAVGFLADRAAAAAEALRCVRDAWHADDLQACGLAMGQFVELAEPLVPAAKHLGLQSEHLRAFIDARHIKLLPAAGDVLDGLLVAAVRLSQPAATPAVDAKPAARPQLSAKERSRRAWDIINGLTPDEQQSIRAEDLAERIPCAEGLVVKLAAWRDLMKRTGRGRADRGPVKPGTVRLSRDLERVAGRRDGQRDAAIDELIESQNRDAEPSPVDRDAPGERVRVYAGNARRHGD